jgi:hypothetical protein
MLYKDREKLHFLHISKTDRGNYFFKWVNGEAAMNCWLSLDTCCIVFVLVILSCYENKISLYIYILFCVFIIYSLCIEIHLYLTFFYVQNKQLQQQKITDDYEWYTSDCEVAL